jgi:hypothetical protein
MNKSSNDTNELAFSIASAAMLDEVLPGTKKFKKLVKEKSACYPQLDPAPVAEIAAAMVSFARSELEGELFSRLQTILDEIERRGCLTSNQLYVINDALNNWILREVTTDGEVSYTYRSRGSEGWDQQSPTED